MEVLGPKIACVDKEKRTRKKWSAEENTAFNFQV